jgi:hypothetical protein
VLKPGGSQGLGCGNDLMGCPYRCPRSSDAYVRLDAKTHADGGDLGISKFQVAAIARARAASPRFQMFPIVNQLTVRCVVFTEGWRPSADSMVRTRAWTVRFSRDGHVRSTVRTAHPPQPWATGDRYTC